MPNEPAPTRCVTRLAPSPTGALHLGNARTFVLNWLLARREGWEIVLRMEDLDGPRIKRGAAEQTLADLRWLGLDWDRQAPPQSTRGEAYRSALDALAAAGMAYRCTCSRRDIELAAGAPHREDALVAYPGTCRDRQHDIPPDAPAAWRVRTEGAEIAFTDGLAGPQRFALADIGGDFVVFKADAEAAYQLAVVVDDAAAGVTHVVRGDDLLDSAARQIFLYGALGMQNLVPRYLHLPLVTGADGRRLAKRHGDTRLDHYRRQGATPQRVLGLIGWWSGLLEAPRPSDLAELLDRFDLARVPRHPVVFTPEDEGFLLVGG